MQNDLVICMKVALAMLKKKTTRRTLKGLDSHAIHHTWF